VLATVNDKAGTVLNSIRVLPDGSMLSSDKANGRVVLVRHMCRSGSTSARVAAEFVSVLTTSDEVCTWVHHAAVAAMPHNSLLISSNKYWLGVLVSDLSRFYPGGQCHSCCGERAHV
jgi:hypothetical protein